MNGHFRTPARHWIDGEWVATGSEAESIDPATGDVIGTYLDGGLEEAEAAIRAAEKALGDQTWTGDPNRRAAALSHLADAYATRLDEVIDTLCLENGKVRAEARFEAELIVRALRFVAGLATQSFGRALDPSPGRSVVSLRQPIGVAGLIIPWNSPAYLAIRALGPALAAGCTAVVKMPHKAAQTAALMADILASVPDLPQGSVNIFIESGAAGAKLLVESAKVRAISYTGSTHTGRAIAQTASASLKRINLELGGKTPHLIFDDVDLDRLLPILTKSSTVFAGQFCMTGSRILVQRNIADQLRDRLARSLEAVRLGPAASASSDMGPLIDKASVSRVDRIVKEAIAAGAKVILRGGPVADGPLAKGAFYRPCLLEVPNSRLEIVQMEVFGPVQTLQLFDSEEEAIELADDTEFGLSACVWSSNADRLFRVSRKLDAGLVSINNWANHVVEFEEGGFKASGLGRLGGVGAIDDFTEIKQIAYNYATTA